MISTPNIGRLVSISGNTMQCIAHASEVAIPRPSQFTFKFIRGYKCTVFALPLQKVKHLTKFFAFQMYLCNVHSVSDTSKARRKQIPSLLPALYCLSKNSDVENE